MSCFFYVNQAQIKNKQNAIIITKMPLMKKCQGFAFLNSKEETKNQNYFYLFFFFSFQN